MSTANALYKALQGNPNIKGLPDEATFVKSLSSPEFAAKFYDQISSNPSIKGLPDKQTFVNTVATQPKPQDTPQPKQAPQEGTLRDVMSLAGTPQRTQVEPQVIKPKQPTIMQSGKGMAQEEKAIPQPQTWQQATDVALVEQGKAPTPEALAEKANIQPQKGIANVFKSQMQKQYETELNTLKRFEEANRLIAGQYEANVVETMGMTPQEVESLTDRLYQSVKPLEMITAQIEKFNAKYDAEMAKLEQEIDPVRKQAIISRLESERKALELAQGNVSQAAEPSLSALRDIEGNEAYVQYKNAKAAEIEAKEGAAKLAFDPKYKDALQDVGEIDGLLNAVTRGLKRAEIADMLAAGKTPTEEDLRKIAKLNREQQAFAQSDAMLRFMDAKGFKESAKAFIINPFEITAQLVTESLVAQISHGITRAGAGAAMGAAIAAPTGVGIPVGAATGFAAGMGVAGYNIEVASSIIESLQEAGIDVNDEESLIAGFNDPEKMAAARKYANLRGVPIGVIDAITGGIGSKISKAPIKSGAKKLAIEMGVEATGAGVGETTAQILSTGKLDGKEIFMEMIGEIGAGAPSIVANRTAAALDVISKKSKASAVPTEARNDAEVEVIEAMRESDLPSEQFNEIVDVHEAAGLIESEVAAEVKQQYEQVQQGKPIKTMQDDLEIGDTVEMSPEVTSQQEVITEQQTEQNAQEQQSEQVRVEGEQVQTEGTSDSDMPIVNETELQVGETVEPQEIDGTAPTTAVSEPIQQVTAEAQEQGVEETVSESVSEVGDGTAEAAPPVLETGKEEVGGNLSEWELAGKKILENQGEKDFKSWITNQPLLGGFKDMKNLANKIGIRFPQTEKQFDEDVKSAGGLDNYGDLIFGNFLQHFIGISDYSPRKNAIKQNEQTQKSIEGIKSLLDDVETNAKTVGAKTGYKLITEKNANKIGKNDLSEHIGKYYFSSGAKITIKTPKQLVSDYVTNKVKELQKNIITESAIEQSEKRVAEIKGKGKQAQPTTPQPETTFQKAGNTYIQRGNDYFIRRGKSTKESPISKGAFERAQKGVSEVKGKKGFTEQDVKKVDTTDLEINKEVKAEDKVKEIQSLPLSHVAGLNMQPDQGVGTYVSTEQGGNRYARRSNKPAKKATVKIKNPYVTKDTGNLGLRQRLIKAFADKFVDADFDFSQKPEGKWGLDDLSQAGMRKLAQLVTDFLKAKGYDSIYFPETNTQEGELIVFDKENVVLSDEAIEEIKYKKNGQSFVLRKYADGRTTRQMNDGKENLIDNKVFIEQKNKAKARSARAKNAARTRENNEGLMQEFNSISFYNDPYAFIVNRIAGGMKIPLSVINEVFNNSKEEVAAYRELIDKNDTSTDVSAFADALLDSYQSNSEANQANVDSDFRAALEEALNVGTTKADFMEEAIAIDPELQNAKQQQKEYEDAMAEIEAMGQLALEVAVQEEMDAFNAMTAKQKAEFAEFLNNFDYEQPSTTDSQARAKAVSVGNENVSQQAKPIGNNEKAARQRLDKAKNDLENKRKAFENKQKELRKQIAKEAQFEIFDKPKNELQADLDVNEATVQKALATEKRELANAEAEVKAAEAAIQKAIDADNAQGDLFAKEQTPTAKERTETPVIAEKTDVKEREAEVKEQAPKYNKDNLPKPTGQFEVVEVQPYNTVEANSFRPNQQLKFNQGEFYDPVRIIANPELIELIQIGAMGQAFKNAPAERIKLLENKYGISAREANKRAKEIAKQERGDGEVLVIVGEQPKATTTKEQLQAEKPKIQTAKEKLEAARKARDDAYKGLGIDAFEQAKKRAEADLNLLKAYIELAKEYIAEGIQSAKDFAAELGEPINDFIKDAWEVAKNNKPIPSKYDIPQPPKPPKDSEKDGGETSIRAIEKRAAEQERKQGNVERANKILNSEAAKYTRDNWSESDTKANNAVDTLLEGTNEEIEQNLRDFLNDRNSIVNNIGAMQTEGGGSVAAFILLKLRERLNERGMEDMADLVTNKLSETATIFGQYISGLQQRAIQEGLLALEVRKKIKEAEAALDDTMLNEVQSLKEVIDELKKKLEVTNAEMKKVLDAKAVTEAAAAAEKKQQRKSRQGAKVKAEKNTAKTPSNNPKQNRRIDQIRSRIKSRDAEIRKALSELFSLDDTIGFAALPENSPVAKLIRLLREQAIDYMKLGVVNLEQVRASISDQIDAVAKKAKVTADDVWESVVSQDFDQLAAEAQSEYLASKLETSIMNLLDEKATPTPQGKVLDAIATVLINRVRKKMPKANKDTALKNAVEVIKNRQLATDAAQAALARVRVLLDAMNITEQERIDAYQRAEDIVNAMTQDALPEAVVRKELAKGLKDMKQTMREVALSHYTTRQKSKDGVRQSLVDKLVALGVDIDVAQQYAQAIEVEFSKQLGEKRQKIVADVMAKDTPTKAANLANNMLKLYRVGSVQGIVTYLSKINFPALTPSQVTDLENATTKEEAKDILEAYTKQANVQRNLVSDVSKALVNKIQDAKEEIESGYDDAKNKVAFVNKVLKDKGGNELTDVQVEAIENGEMSKAEISQLVQDKIRTKGLMSALGRTLTGDKRTQAKQKSATQKLIELAEMGVFEDAKAAEIFAENYGLPILTQKDIDILNAYIANMVAFTGETSKLYEMHIKNYLERMKLLSANSPLIVRYNALLRGMRSAYTRFLLSGLGTNLVSIPVGTISGFVFNGLPAFLTLAVSKPDVMKAIFELYQKNNVKGIGLNDFKNVMTNEGISQLQSDFTGEFTDKQSVVGDVASYYEQQKWKDLSTGERIIRGMLSPYLAAIRASRFSMAFDLLFNHPIGELMNIWDEMDARIGQFNDLQSDPSNLREILQDNAKRDAFMKMVEKELGYSDRKAAEIEADAEIEKMLDMGMDVDKGKRDRLIKTNIMKRRNAERMEKAYEKAKKMGYMNMPQKGTVEGNIYNAISRITRIDDKSDLKALEKSAFATPLIMALNTLKTATHLSLFTFIRIGIILAKASMMGVPAVPAVYYGIKRLRAKTTMEEVFTSAGMLTNMAITIGAAAVLLSQFKLDDEDDELSDEAKIKVFGLPIKQKKDPYIKFYGKSPLKSYSEQERLRISTEFGSEAYPEWAVQFGDGSPKSIRFHPWLYFMVSGMSKLQEPKRITKIEKLYGNPIEIKDDVNTWVIMKSLYETLQANSFAIGADNFENLFLNLDDVAKQLTTTKKDVPYDQKPDFDFKNFESKKNADAFVKTILSIPKGLMTPSLMRDMTTYSQNLIGGKEEAKNTMSDRFFSDNLYYETLVNPLLVKRNGKAFDSFGLPYKENVNLDEIIRTLTLDAVAPNDNFEKEVTAKSKMPLYKLMTDKKVPFPYYGAFETDLSAEMIGLKEGQKITKDDVAIVDQYIRLNITSELVEKFNKLQSLDGLEFYQTVTKIAEKEKKYALKRIDRKMSLSEIEKENKRLADYIIKTQEGLK